MEYSLLMKSPLFKGLKEEEIISILSDIPYRIKKIKTGSLLSQSGDQVNSLMIVTEGFVKGEMADYAGRLIKIEDIHAPGALAPAFMFGNNNRFPVDIVAGSDCEILLIEKSNFLNY